MSIIGKILTKILSEKKAVLTLLVVSAIFGGLFIFLSSKEFAPGIKKAGADSEYLYEAANDLYTFSIGQKDTNSPNVEFGLAEKGTISFFPMGVEWEEINIKKRGKSVTFENIYPNVDLKYTTLSNGIKEEIVLNEKTNTNEFVYRMALTDTKAGGVMEQFPSPTFYDTDGNYLFHFEKPFALDEGGNRTDDVQMQVKKLSSKDNEYQIKIILSEDWMNDPERKYPIIIDPTVVHDTTSEFADGTFNRVTDTGSPQLETYYQESTTDEHTVGLWHMNEGTDNTCTGGEDVCDLSGNDFDGTFSGTTAFNGTGKIGADSVVLDGNSDYITVTENDALDPAEITIEVWINVNTFQLGNFINKGGNSGYRVRTNADATITFFDRGGTNSITSSSALNAGEWYHLAFTGNSSGLKIYINGALDTYNSTAYGGPNTASDLIMGLAESTEYYFGLLDEVRISNTARSPEEIKVAASRRTSSVYTSPVIDFGDEVASWQDISWTEAGVTTGDGETVYDSTSLVAQWNFNETSGTTANNDAEGTSCGGTPSNCDGTLSGFDSTASQDADPDSSWTANNRRWGAGALQFDGINSYVSTADNNNLSFGDGSDDTTFSIGAWIKIHDDLSDDNIIIQKWDATNSEKEWQFRVSTEGNLQFKLYDQSSASKLQLYGYANVNDGNWHYVATTYDGSESANGMEIYVDGKIDTKSRSSDGGYVAMENLGEGIFIGAIEGTSEFYNGVIDTVQLYSSTLSANEILSMYNSSNIQFETRVGSNNSPNGGSWDDWTPSTSETQIDSFDSPLSKDLIAHWKLDETSGTRKDSRGINDLTDNNTVTSADGIVNTAGQFTAANSEYLSITDNTDLSTGDIDFTLSAWVYMDSKPASNMTILSKRTNNTTEEYRLYWDVASGKFIFVTYQSDGIISGWATAHNFGIPSLNTWYHVVAWQDTSNDEIGIKINDTQNLDTDLVGVMSDTSSGFSIGATDDTGGLYWDGRIDEVAFWKRTLTSAEISTLYNSGKPNFYPDGTDFSNISQVGGIHSQGEAIIKTEGTGSEKITIGKPQIDANTVALWHLDETNGNNAAGDDIFDETANNNDGEFTGTNIATAVVEGISGKARDFNGSDDYIDAGTDASLAMGSGDFTISAWINPTDDADTQVIAGRGSQDVGGKRYYLYIDNTHSCSVDELVIEIDDDGGTKKYVCSTNSNYYDGWHYVVGVRDGNNLRLYIDGVEDPSSPTDITGYGSIDNSHGFKIGSVYDEALADQSAFYNGSIDEVKVSNIAHTAEEIAEAYRMGRDHYINKTISSTDLSSKETLPFYVAADRPGTYLSATIGESAYANYQPDANTVGLWHMDEGTNNACNGGSDDACDASGNGNHGDETGSPPIVQGKIGKARDFDGSADYINMGDRASLDMGTFDITVSGWVKTNETVTAGYITDKRDSAYNGGGKGYSTKIAADGTLQIGIGDGTNYLGDSTALSNNTVNDGKWHYVAYVFDRSGNVTGYIDSIEQLSVSISSIGNIDTTGNFVIGTRAYTPIAYFDGLLDEVRISDVARTADEIRQAYEIGLRSHPITIDFAASLDSGDLIASSSDTSFTVDGTTYGLSDKGSSLFAGDKIIVREVIDDTTYIAQGTVTGVTVATGAVTITSWDLGSTFPSSGYTVHASVFKWQEEVFPIEGSFLDAHKDAITNLTLRVTDGNEGRTVWLDDLKSAGNYLTTSTGSTITSSSGKQYAQYRALFSSTDSMVSANLTSVSMGYVMENAILFAKFDENYGSTAFDYTSYGMDGTVGGATWRPNGECVFRSCLSFDGTDDYVTFSDNDNLDMGIEDFTVAFWMRSGDSSGDKRLVAKRDGYVGDGTDVGYEVYLNDGVLEAFIGDGSGLTLMTSNRSVTDNKWYYVTVVFDRDSNGQIYIDGILDKETSISTRTATLANTKTLEVGRSTESTPGQYAGAFIDEFKIYNYARTAAEVKTDYNNAGTVKGAAVSFGPRNSDFLTNGLVGYWKMDEDSANGCSGGEDSCDSSGNETHGTWTNNATNASGKYGQGLTFDGAGDYVTITDSVVHEPETITIAAWIYNDSISDDWLISKEPATPDNNYGYYLRVDTPTDNAYCRFGLGSTSVLAATTNTLTSGQWHHIACTYDGNTAKMYLDGNFEYTSGEVQGTLNYTGVGDMLFGTQSDLTNDYAGDLDEVRIYNHALSPIEIQGLYNWAPGPVGYWDLNENSGTSTTADKSGNGYTGTLNGTMTNDDWVQGKFGSALEFDGTNDYISIGSTLPEINTIGFWVKPTSTTESLIQLNDVTKLTIESGTVIATGFTSPTIYINGIESSTISANEWSYVTLVTDTKIEGGNVQVGISDVTPTPATGGTITYYGNYTIHTFTNSGTFTPHEDIDVDVLVVGGGGAGGSHVTRVTATSAGGGGAGGLTYSSGFGVTSEIGLTVTVGVGGISPATQGVGGSGGTSAFDSISVTGGGGGGGRDWNGASGGSGGGGGYNHSGGAGTGGQGNSGGSGTSDNFGAPGGGGAGGSGVASSGSNDGKDGGGGLDYGSTFGTSSGAAGWFAGGGGGGGRDGYSGGNGLNGGGNGGTNANGVSATNETGGGGGGAGDEGFLGGDGGDGVVIVRYTTSEIKYLEGTLDEIKIYNYERTPAQIIEDMNGGHPIGGSPIASQVGYWSLDEMNGQNTYDRGTGDNTGTLGADTTASTDDPTWKSNSSCKVNSCLSFDGGDYVTIADNDALDIASKMTFTGWFNVTDTAADRPIISKGDEYLIRFDSDDTFNFFLFDGVDYEPRLTAPTNPTAGMWHHFAAVYDSTLSSNHQKIYLDGSLIAQQDRVITTTPTVNSLRIGEFGGSTYMEGSLDELKIYDTALSASEVLVDMNAGGIAALGGVLGTTEESTTIDGTPTDPIGSWNFNNGGTSANSHGTSAAAMNNSDGPTISQGKYGKGLDFESSNEEFVSEFTGGTGSLTTQPDETSGFDYYMSSFADWRNNQRGDYDAFHVGNDDLPENNTVRTVIKFDLSSIPSSATITDATMTLTTYASSHGSNDASVHVYQLLRDSVEMEATYNIWKTGSNWTVGSAGSDGNDYDSTSWGNITISESYAGTNDISLDTTYFQNYIDGTWNNYGWVLRTTAENNDIRRFRSAAYTTATDRPKLVVNYTYLSGTPDTDLNLTGDVTTSAWIKPESTTASTLFDIVGKWDGSNESYLLAQYGDEIRMYIDSSSNYETTDSVNLVAGNWYHVTSSYDASAQTVKIYVNGALQDSTTTGTIPASIGTNTTAPVVIGAEDILSTAANFYDGVIDDVKIHNVVLTGAQVAYNFNRGGPIGWWKLDDCTGTTAYDLSGNKNNGTITIGATGTNTSAGTCTGSSGEAWKDGATGKLNSSLELDGVDDYIGMNDTNFPIGADDRTVMAWVKTPDFDTQQMIFTYGTDTTSDRLELGTRNDGTGGKIVIAVNGGAYGTADIPNDGTWSHLTVVLNGASTISDAKLYIDGKLKTTTLQAGSDVVITTISNGSAQIGVDIARTSDRFEGQVDDIRVYNYALSETQIKNVMLGGVAQSFN